MLEDLRSRARTIEELCRDTLAVLSAQYGGSSNTADAARKQALAAFHDFLAEDNAENP